MKRNIAPIYTTSPTCTHSLGGDVAEKRLLKGMPMKGLILFSFY
jgi:hypothetical protein